MDVLNSPFHEMGELNSSFGGPFINPSDKQISLRMRMLHFSIDFE
jgi:hypothetical protein